MNDNNPINNKYRFYELSEELIVNEFIVRKVIIWNHYEEHHSDYMNDQLILEIVKRLNGKDFFFHRSKFLPDGRE